MCRVEVNTNVRRRSQMCASACRGRYLAVDKPLPLPSTIGSTALDLTTLTKPGMHLRPLFFILVLNSLATPSFANSIRLEDISSAPAAYFSRHPDLENAAAPAAAGQELLAPITSIPEPSALLLTGAGVVVLVRRLTRRRRTHSA